MERGSGEPGAVHVKKSDKEFERLFNLANDLAIAKNPQRWFNLANPDNPDFFTEEERLNVVDEITRQLGDALAEVSDIQKVPLVIRRFIEDVLGPKLDELP